MPAHRLRLRLLPPVFAICRLDSMAAIPEWIPPQGFTAIIRTAEELAIYSESASVPANVQANRGWRAFELVGPFDFSESGVIASVAAPLAEAGISISVLATYDTDYVFVRQEALGDATQVLSAAGHRILGPD